MVTVTFTGRMVRNSIAPVTGLKEYVELGCGRQVPDTDGMGGTRAIAKEDQWGGIQTGKEGRSTSCEGL